MYCSSCQNQNEKNAQFCKNCGTKLLHPPKKSENDILSNILLFVFTVIVCACAYPLSNRPAFVSTYAYFLFMLIISILPIIAVILTIKNKSLKNSSSILLLVYIFITMLVYIFITMYYWEVFFYLGGPRYIVILHHISFILPALAIKNKSMKIIGVILALIATMLFLYKDYLFYSFLL